MPCPSPHALPTSPAGLPLCLDLRYANVYLGPAGQTMALRGVSVQIASGERVALVGSNGSGKTTLLRTLHGLERLLPPGVLLRPAGQRQAMLFQRPHMLRMSALGHVALGVWLSGVPWRRARERARTALEQVDMLALAGRCARQLSGGQQQRLALARAWALQPDVWLLDEPTASLDPRAQREVESLISQFTARPPAGSSAWPTLIFSSHNLGQVKRLASRVIYLEDGQVLADLPVHAFFDSHRLRAVCAQAHLFVQGEIG